ncbi:MAG: MBL fold metallo-hydrolase [Candidatus Paceibacterota bacterium]|jgi:L-ascorbate metabolism protein UlaG (beta-lactamase superfamily)
MIITYQGGNYFKIQSGDFAILIDPENQRSFRGTNIVLNTIKPALIEAPEPGEGVPIWIDTQGEYEVQGIRVQGWSAGYDEKEKKERTVYRILFDEMTIAVLGGLTTEPDASLTSQLADTDIAIVPAGGKPYLSQGAAAKIVRQLEPGIIIPSFTNDPKLFLKELGKTEVSSEEKLVVKKKDIEEKAMKVVWLHG